MSDYIYKDGTTTYGASCSCKGTSHDVGCWTAQPAVTSVTDWQWTVTYPLCSCGYRGMHSLPYHLWRYWFPNVSWLRTTWGDQS